MILGELVATCNNKAYLSLDNQDLLKWVTRPTISSTQSLGLCDHYSELVMQMIALKFKNAVTQQPFQLSLNLLPT